MFQGSAKKQGAGGVNRQAKAIYFPGQGAATGGADVAEGTFQQPVQEPVVGLTARFTEQA